MSPVKYAILAVLLFAPLAVAGTYLSDDPTRTEVPKIQLRTDAKPVAKAPARARKAQRSVKKAQVKQNRRATSRKTHVRRAAADSPAEETGEQAAGPPPAAGGTDDDDAQEEARPARRAAPVPIPPPATAGIPSGGGGGEADDDDGGGGSGDDGDD